MTLHCGEAAEVKTFGRGAEERISPTETRDDEKRNTLSADTAIEVSHLTKKFKIYQNVFTDRIKEKLFFWRAERYFDYFTALDDISLQVRSGEVLGLIGANGAGKTTFLKILSQISYPTSGQVNVRGNLVAVLALGLGFNMRFTGRENILVGGCLLGMSQEEIREKEDWIIDFAELRYVIDQPIRSYSSGMLARLSFSVAAAVSPDVLIVDEALATGDSFFVQKSLKRIHDIASSGTTAVFVSHNLQQIQRLCSRRVVLMQRGRIVDDDIAHKVIKRYNDLVFEDRQQNALKERMRRQLAQPQLCTPLDERREWFGNGEIVIERIYFTDAMGREVQTARTGEKLDIHLQYNARTAKRDVRLVVVAENYAGIVGVGLRSDNYLDGKTQRLTQTLFDFSPGRGEIVLHCEPLLLTTNKYLFSVTLYDSQALYDSQSDFLDQTIFSGKHMKELDVFKPNDPNNTLIVEHPVRLEQRRCA